MRLRQEQRVGSNTYQDLPCAVANKVLHHFRRSFTDDHGVPICQGISLTKHPIVSGIPFRDPALAGHSGSLIQWQEHDWDWRRFLAALSAKKQFSITGGAGILEFGVRPIVGTEVVLPYAHGPIWDFFMVLDRQPSVTVHFQPGSDDTDDIRWSTRTDQERVAAIAALAVGKRGPTFDLGSALYESSAVPGVWMDASPVLGPVQVPGTPCVVQVAQMGPTPGSASDGMPERVSALAESAQGGAARARGTASSSSVAGTASMPEPAAATAGVAAQAASASAAPAVSDNPWDERTVAMTLWPDPPAARPCTGKLPPAPKTPRVRDASSQRTDVWPGLPKCRQKPSSHAVGSQDAWSSSNWHSWDTPSATWQSGATSWRRGEGPQRSDKWEASGPTQAAQSDVTATAAAAAPAHMPVAPVAPLTPLPVEPPAAARPSSAALAAPAAVLTRPTLSPWAVPLRGVPAGYAPAPADVAMVPPPALHAQAAAPGPSTAMQRPWFQLISDSHADWCGAIVVLHGGSVLSRSWSTWFALQGPGPMLGPWDPKQHSWLRLASVTDGNTVSALAALRARPGGSTMFQ